MFLKKKNLNLNYTTSDVEILISTMNQSNFDFLQNMFCNVVTNTLNFVIINQTNPNTLLISNNKNITVINDFGNGLSRSRNIALKNSSKEILVFTDDDVVYKSDFVETITNSFNKYKNATIIQFQIEDFNNFVFRKYHKKEKLKLSQFQASNAMSVELAIKRSFLIDNNITYDELFGLGSVFKLGEENILISDIISKKGVVHFLPITIAQHPKQISVESIKNKERYFYLGAFYARQFLSNYFLWILIKLFFDIKHKKTNWFDLQKLIRASIKGKKEYEKYGR